MAQRKRGAAKNRVGDDQTPPAPQPSPARFTELPPVRALTLPLTFTLLLIALGLLPSAQHNLALALVLLGCRRSAARMERRAHA